jgi:HAD superfamily hydrolase (TIGR01450 family)
MKVKALRVFFFDLDGVLSVGKEKPRYLGGREVVSRLKELGKKAYVLTNDSTQTREEISRNLSGLGFTIAVDEILTSSYLTARYLTERFGHARFYLVGEQGLRRELETAGHESSDHPQVVVVALDRQLTYEKLNDALAFLRAGAVLVGSYGGAVYMSASGPALSAGPIVKTLEFASGKRAAMIGKPATRMFRLALTLANERPNNAVMVGDQVETDLIGARKAGIHTILVLTGVETEATMAHSKFKPDAVIETVDDMGRLLGV